ncbi:MAG: hypothetical protein HY613_00915, partial [Candidatus Rokubacteria bacterium]|nr:hypothetical protein [Candidatus Rokubacteria bacterium]
AGLPVGLQIVGRAWEEAMVLRIGHAYEQATEWHTRRPPLTAVPVSSGPDGETAQPDVRGIDPEEVDASWVLTNARLHELNYVTEADAEAIAAGLRPVKRGLALAREALGESWELATHPAVSR